jgi:glucan 1,3-beta-glucosidase
MLLGTMRLASFALVYALVTSFTLVAGLGSTCSTPLSGGTAASGAAYWLETIAHQGTAPYSSNPSSYKVFRNVKDYGAKVSRLMIIEK